MADPMVQQIAAKSDAELLDMLLKDARQYRPEVLETAAREAAGRGLSLEPTHEDMQTKPEPPADTAEPAKGFVCYAGGRIVICPHCSGRRFLQRRILLNTRALTLFQLDWLNQSAFVLMCLSCYRLEWFAHVESRLEEVPEPASDGG